MYIKKSTCVKAKPLLQISSLSAALLAQSTVVSAQSIEDGAITVSLTDELVTVSSQVIVRVETTGCIGVFPEAVRTDPENMTVDLSYRLSSLDISGFECGFSQIQNIPIGPVYLSGDYTLNVYDNSGSLDPGYFDGESLIGTIDFSVAEGTSLANPETPTDGSIQSGIGVIRGWACDARSVEVSFNDLPPFALAYGTSREDTRTVCGDANNGYGGVFAFGLLGNGSHTMTTWIDGAAYETVEFQVNGLPDQFIEGLSAEYELSDFPSAGEMVLIRWSQPDQNFIVIDHTE